MWGLIFDMTISKKSLQPSGGDIFVNRSNAALWWVPNVMAGDLSFDAGCQMRLCNDLYPLRFTLEPPVC